MTISDLAVMPLPISNCFSDLLCGEDSGTLSTDSLAEDSGTFFTDSPAECSPVINSSAPFSDEESIAGYIEDEINFVQGVDQSSQIRPVSLDPSDRAQSVSWMLKVRSYYGFQELTAYLAVNYFDRFLVSYRLPQSNGWTLQLLSVACLSLAAKMEEPLVPLLHHFQVEGAKFVFTPKTIQRMELLVLGVLGWRLRTVTPFSYISFFTSKVDATGTFMGFLILRSTTIILSNLQDASLLEYRPSSIAAAAVLCAASEIPNMSLVTPEHAESWCNGLSKEKVIDCYKLMKHVMTGTGTRQAQQELRVRSSSFSNYCFCSSTPSTSPTCSNNTKRRKLNNSSWVDVDSDDDKIKYESD